jgi:hypothetical protein
MLQNKERQEELKLTLLTKSELDCFKVPSRYPALMYAKLGLADKTENPDLIKAAY